MDEFNTFVNNLSSGRIDYEYLERLESNPDLLSGPLVGDPEVNRAVKLPALIANAAKGNFDGRKVKIWLAKCGAKLLLGENRRLASVFLDKMLLNFGFDSDAMKFLCEEMKVDSGQRLLQIALNLTEKKKENLVKCLVVNSENSENLETFLGRNFLSAFKNEPFLARILFGSNLDAIEGQKFVCYLSRQESGDEAMIHYLILGLEYWSDPVIARGFVRREIVHYTKLCLTLFAHCDPKVVLTSQMRLVELLVRGLPNHYNSTDPRTVTLAKFFSQILTESIKKFADPNHELSEDALRTEDDLCVETLEAIHDCSKTKTFPVANVKVNANKMERMDLNEGQEEKKESELCRDSDDDSDDDDLKPIESMDVPMASKIRYLRDFLEKFPEMEAHSEVKSSFLAVPSVIKNQLALEHPSMGEELIDLVFLWENQFEDAVLDEARKSSLESILVSKADGNVQHLCRLFHREHVQPYRKNIVFEVITRAVPKLTLVDLRTVTKSVFQLLLIRPEVIQEQDLTVRIPFVVFLGNLLTASPEVMLEEQHVADFLRSLTKLRKLDAATEQAVKYSVNKVMTNVGDKRILSSPKVRECIAETRDFLLAVESNR